MTRSVSYSALAVLLAAMAKAETPLTGSDFAAHVQGKTFAFSADGEIFGIEEYLSDNRVRWSYLDNICHEGVWYPVEDQICFDYESFTETQCWRFFLDGGDLTARFVSDPDDPTLYQTTPRQTPVTCPGPEVGA